MEPDKADLADTRQAGIPQGTGGLSNGLLARQPSCFYLKVRICRCAHLRMCPLPRRANPSAERSFCSFMWHAYSGTGWRRS